MLKKFYRASISTYITWRSSLGSIIDIILQINKISFFKSLYYNNKVIKFKPIIIIGILKNKKDVIKVFNKQHQSSDIMMKYIDPQGDNTYPNIYDQFDKDNGLEYNIYNTHS